MPTNRTLLDIIRFQTDIAKLGLDLGGVMSHVVNRTLSLFNADGAAIELAEGSDMVYRATSGIAEPYIGLRLNLKGSLSGLSVESGETLRCDDSETDERVDRDACRKIGLRSMIALPLRHGNKAVGVLKAMSSQPAKFSDDDIEALGLMADLISAAMFHAAKFDKDALYYQATHDGLTGLANRALFMDNFRSSLSQSARNHQSLCVLMIDMDGLKQINDNFGHRIGDAVICEFSKRLMDSTRASDTVARLGGDEFSILLTPIELPDGLDTAIERLTSSIDIPFLFEGKIYQLRASIGSATYPDDGNDLIKLVEIADQRMYAVKQDHHRASNSQNDH